MCVYKIITKNNKFQCYFFLKYFIMLYIAILETLETNNLNWLLITLKIKRYKTSNITEKSIYLV